MHEVAQLALRLEPGALVIWTGKGRLGSFRGCGVGVVEGRVERRLTAGGLQDRSRPRSHVKRGWTLRG